jgi:NADPH:quinone reductase-like Zn-dependent oxidoreductase
LRSNYQDNFQKASELSLRENDFCMPRIVRFHKLGGPENLVLEQLPSRQPGEGEAKLRVDAVGLNRAESGFYRGGYFEKPVLPSRLGYEAAGTVEAVGPGVDAGWIAEKWPPYPVSP